MDCEKVSELLSPYLDGELEPSERNLVSSHLEICSACCRELAELQAAVQIFRQLPELAPGPAFRPRLRERLARENHSLPAGVSDSPAALPNGGQALPSAPRFPGATAPAGHSGKSREVLRRAGLRTVSGLFRHGARLWPKLAVAAILLLAMGITSLWYGLAGPGLVPKLPVGQLTGTPPQPKDKEARGEWAEPVGGPERKSAGDARSDLSGAQPEETRPFAPPEQVPEQVPLPALASGREKGRKFSTNIARPEEVQEKTGPAAPGTIADQKEKEEATAAGGSVAAKALLDRAAPPKKMSRRIKIELTGADVQKLSLLLAEFARDGKQAAATGPVTGGSGQNPNTLAAKVEVSKMPGFLSQMKLLGKILKQEETSQDLTADYARLETELKQKQAQAGELEKIILAQNKNSRSAREVDDGSSLAGELKKIQMEIQSIQEKLQRMDEELKMVSVEIYWQK